MRTFTALACAFGLLTATAGSAADADKQAARAAKRALALAEKIEPAKPSAPKAAPAAAPTQPDTTAPELARRIDAVIDAALSAAKVQPSPRSSDAEFLRRVWLDIVGVIPTADEAAGFLDSTDPNKRAKLIDKLLADSRYGRHMADEWSEKLFPRTSDNRKISAKPLYDWLEKQFADNVPWDKMATELLTATGDQDDHPAVTFAAGNITADKMTDRVARLFMGVRLECAQCHNHPFTEWKQADYWHTAAFFTKVRYSNGNPNPQRGNTVGIAEAPRIVAGKLPESAKLLPPQFLGGDKPKLDPQQPYRPVFARWLTSADNKFFAKAMANRTWANLFGRGIVNPVDDMIDEHEASHPELLTLLAADFTKSHFDVKHLTRAICLSEAYQRSSRPAASGDKADKLFAHMAVKVMMPQQLFDSLVSAIGVPDAMRERANKATATKGRQMTPRDNFVTFFTVGGEDDPTEYEAGIPQALRLMNNGQMQRAFVMGRELSAKPLPQALDRLYLATLSRRPTEVERAKLASHIAKSDAKPNALGDVIWAVLNSSEFTVVR